MANKSQKTALHASVQVIGFKPILNNYSLLDLSIFDGGDQFFEVTNSMAAFQKPLKASCLLISFSLSISNSCRSK